MIRIAAKIISLLLPAAILAAAGGAVFFLFATAPKAGRAPGGHAAPIVEVAEVSRTPFQRTVEASGIVMPAREVEIHPEVSGRIIEIHPALQPGGVIPEGAVLVRIDPEEYELALDQAKSALAEAEAALEVEQGRQLVAKREWELYGKTLPDADLGQALALREPQLRQAEARIESARSVVRQAELDLRRTTISAPFRALVLEESVDIGQQVSPGSPMAALAGAEAFWIQATLPAAQLEAVLAAAAQGEAAARIYLPIEGMPSGEPILGVLVRHLGTVDPKGHMAQVLLEVKDPPQPGSRQPAPAAVAQHLRPRRIGRRHSRPGRRHPPAIPPGKQRNLGGRRRQQTANPYRRHSLAPRGNPGRNRRLSPRRPLGRIRRNRPAPRHRSAHRRSTFFRRTRHAARRLMSDAMPEHTAPPDSTPPPTGIYAVIDWLTRNHVAANILMMTLLIGGLASTMTIKQEVFPSFQLDIVDIRVSYPGSSPQEVEDGIVLPIEEVLIGLDVIERIESSANEGGASFQVELIEGVDPNRALQDVKNAIDSISFFPEEAERPTLGLRQEQNNVVWMVIYGPLEERKIFELAERVRRDLLAMPSINRVEVRSPRDPEIHIEIPQERLRALNLTLNDVAQIIRESARDIPAGGVRTDGGEIRLTTRERRDFASEYGDIVLLTNESGGQVRLRDVATLRDGFTDRPFVNTFNGGLGIFVSIYETGEGNPLDISSSAKQYVEQIRKELPEGCDISIMRDRAEQYRERLFLLLRNGAFGLALVLLVLGLFLQPRLAFWVAMGVPTAIAGSLLLLPAMGASINMVSLFAFIITLGIVVDDAVVVGENVFHYMQGGMPRLQAALTGTREMAVPVFFSVLTNIIAFVPLLYVPGENGRFFAPLPAVVIAVFSVSLIEALFVLPAHLGHGKEIRSERGFIGWIGRGQRHVSNTFERFTDRVVVPMIQYAVRHHFTTLSILFGLLAVMLSWYYTGRMHYTFSPVITGLRVDAEVQTPVGAAFADTVRIANHVEQAGLRAGDRLGGRDNVISGRMNVVGRRGENWADVNFYLVGANERNFTEAEFAEIWREEVGEVPGLKSLFFEWEEGPGSGAGLTVQLSHPDQQDTRSRRHGLGRTTGHLYRRVRHQRRIQLGQTRDQRRTHPRRPRTGPHPRRHRPPGPARFLWRRGPPFPARPPRNQSHGAHARIRTHLSL